MDVIESAATLPMDPPPKRYVAVNVAPGSGMAPKTPSPKRRVSPASPS